MFDAGEFWISCATKSTALHVAATSNRLHCSMAILQYYVRRVHPSPNCLGIDCFVPPSFAFFITLSS